MGYFPMFSSGDAPFISICMPIYRRTAFIRQALESCLKQSYANFEIIVHDDTEDDSLKTIIDSYASEKVRYFRNIPPLGIVGKLNDFLEKSEAKWLVIVCDDDSLEPDYLKALSRHIKNHPSAPLIRCRYRLIDHAGKELRLDNSSPVRSDPFEFLRDLFLPEKKTFKTNISGVLFQRLLLKSLGGFKNLYRGWHVDRLAWAEIGSRGESICEPAPLCNVRLHADSITVFTEPYYKKAVASDLKMKEIIEQLFDELGKKAETSEECKNLKEAREGFRDYMNRHLSKSIDRGFVAALQDKDKDALKETGEIFKTMKALKVPFFRSAGLYRLLAPLPYPVRALTLTTLQRHKMKKLIS